MNIRSEEHTSELQSHLNLVCRLLLEKKKNIIKRRYLGITATMDGCECCRYARACSMNQWGVYMTFNAAVESIVLCVVFFFLNDPAPTEIYPLPLHDALPI